MEVATELRSFGCVLWEAKPGYSLDSTKPSGELFALANWFGGGAAWYEHNIKIEESATGLALVNGSSYTTPDVQNDANTYKAKFVREQNIRAAVMAPLKFADGTPGALDVYRKDGSPSFNQNEVALAIEIAHILPKLFQTIRDRVGYSLSRKVNEQFQAPPIINDGAEARLGTVMKKVAVLIREHIECLEVSVFLINPLKRKLGARLRASTLSSDKDVGQEAHHAGDKYIGQEAHHAGETGPAGYVLNHKQAVRIFDLKNFDVSDPNIQSIYPGLSHADSGYVECIEQVATCRCPECIQQIADRELKAVNRTLPPLSFMAARIQAGDTPLGIVRCCLPIAGPAYFADREVKTLELLAGQIGQYVSDQQQPKRDRERE